MLGFLQFVVTRAEESGQAEIVAEIRVQTPNQGLTKVVSCDLLHRSATSSIVLSFLFHT